jgi:SRSO17 transposase
MNKTYTPELAPEVLQRLRDYAEQFRDLYRYPTQFSWSGVYLRGLLQDGDRKSIEPMAARVPRPAELLDIRDPEQALQQFVNQSPWDEPTVEKRYRSVMAGPLASPRGIFVIDDTGFPKQGKHSVGVQRQYCGQLGKKANCQVAVTVHYVSPKGHFPAALRLYLPESWTRSPERLEAVGVPERYREKQTKGQIALDLLDQVRREELLPGDVVITDAGYGVAQEFRAGLAQRGLFYIAGVTSGMVVFTEEPRWEWPQPATRGRRPTNPHLAERNPRPVRLEELARRLPRRKVTWREGTKGKLSGKFSWVRVWPAQGWERGQCAGAEPLWLLIEEQADGKIQFAFSNLPVGTSRPLAGGARLSADEGGAGVESFRGPFVARVPSPRLPGDVSVWLLGAGTTACEGGPGIAGEQKWLRAEADGPRNPPRPPTILVSESEAGLRALQSILSFINWMLPNLNGVVLEALTKSTTRKRAKTPREIESSPAACFVGL